MTSQSASGSVSSDEDIILVSSDDDNEHIINSLHLLPGSSNGRTIRELVRKGKQLLTLAEVKSRPEDFRNDAARVYRYNFSSAVTGCDLFRDRDLKELFDVVSTLRVRLSAERVFSLGCPQLRSERDVFDELLMRFSDELLDAQQRPHSPDSSTESASVNVSTESVNVNTDSVSVNSELLPVQFAGFRSNMSNGSASGIFAETSNSISDNLSNSELNFPTGVIMGESNSGAALGEGAATSAPLVQYHNDQLGTNVNISSLEYFHKTVMELNSLINQHPRPILVEAEGQKTYQSLLALQASLSCVLKTSPPNSQSPSQGKRKRSEDSGSETVKKSKTQTESNDDDEEKDEDCCSICLEPWTTGGDHRVTCLKCGHLFGLSCILKWVEQAHSCPQCKTSAKKSDLRHLFVRKIIAEDTSERDRAMRLLEEEKIARRNMEQKEAMTRKKLEMQAADLDTLRTEISQMRAQLPEAGRCVQLQTAAAPASRANLSSSQATSNKRFQLFHRVTISQEGSCRVFDNCKELGLLVASQKSTNTLFRGYGIKILARDFRPLSYQPLHSAAIRDISFRPDGFDGMLLSCGLDKSLQLTSITSKVVVLKYTVNSSAWCCAWNTHNTNLFYAGMERGVVKEFDIRRTDSHVQDVLDYGGGPVSSIQYWNGAVDGSSVEGLLIAHLQNLIFVEQVGETFTTHRFPQLQAPVMSLSLHQSGRFLSSFRPGSQFPKCRYEMSNLCLSQVDDMPRTMTSRCQAVWEGTNMQAVISRNSLIKRPESEDGLLAVTANHSNNTACVWDCDRKQDLQTLPCYDKAIDIKSLSDDLLAVLTDKELLLYKWRH